MDNQRKKRNIRTGKSIYLKQETPEVTYYEIELTIINKGDNNLIDYRLEDIIPKEFELVYDPLANIAENSTIEGGVLRTWVIQVLEKGKVINFRYEIKGATGIKYEFL